MTIDQAKLDELKALAEAAPNGPWRVAGCSDEHTEAKNSACYRVRDADNGPVEKRSADYIAAANPQVMLTLIAELERLRAELAQHAAECPLTPLREYAAKLKAEGLPDDH